MSGCKKVYLWSAVLAGLLTLSVGGQAQNPTDRYSIAVNALDTHGKVIGGLTRSDFRIVLNGRPVRILDARYGVTPRRIVVLLDTSGSMKGLRGPEKWKIACEAVRDLLALIPGDVPIAMLTFAKGVTNKFEFSNGRTGIAKWLGENPSEPTGPKHRQTALFDAILEGLQLLSPAQAGDALYAITDGDDNASDASESQTKSPLLQSGTRLFGFLLSEPGIPDSADRKSSFPDLVDTSGGFAVGISGHSRPVTASWEVDYSFNKDTRDKIDAYTKEINMQISGFWTLDFVEPSSKSGGKIKLEVIGRDGKARKDIFLTYPRFLTPQK